jgi:8-oxo-dGTP pyrophosphatase MutT (NUDIX family)
MLFTDAAFEELGKKVELKTYFTLPEPEIGTRDFVTSVNRVAFAAYHWDEFKNLNEDILGRFEFEWFPNPKLENHPNIEALCTALKKKYKPRCNQEYKRPHFEVL